MAYIPVAAPVPAAGRVSMLQIPAAELAVAVHTGTLADVDQTYGALGIYVAEREIGVGGPIREQYLVTPFDTAGRVGPGDRGVLAGRRRGDAGAGLDPVEEGLDLGPANEAP